MCESVLMSSIYNNYSINNCYNVPSLNFRSNTHSYIPTISHVQDGYTSNPMYENFGTKADIEAAAKTNPKIREILSKHNLSVKINEKELEKLKSGHLQSTRITAAKIYSGLPTELKSQVDPKVLQEAAMFHDYGKILIPDSVLNKDGKLTEDEWKIMEEHSELGAELLKNKNLDKRTIDLIKYHHQTPNKNGYPSISDEFEYGLDSEILSVADKYEALREERSYKPAMSKQDALAIIAQDVKNGLVSQEVFDSLKKNA